VRAFVEASPGVQRIPGPHSITLLAHAKAGGAPAQEVLDYLQALGDADFRPPAESLAEDQRRKYLGRYAFGPGASDSVEVSEGRMGMTIARNGQPGRVLTYLGDHTFRPAGADAVRILFTVEGERASAVSVFDPGLLMRARRTGG
jgi:hypothetical protein